MAINARIGLQVRGPKMLHSRAIKILLAFNSALDRRRRIFVYTPIAIFTEVPTRLCILQVHKTPWMGTRVLGQPLEQCIVDCIESNDINQPGKMPQDDKRERDSAQIIITRPTANHIPLHKKYKQGDQSGLWIANPNESQLITPSLPLHTSLSLSLSHQMNFENNLIIERYMLAVSFDRVSASYPRLHTSTTAPWSCNSLRVPPRTM